MPSLKIKNGAKKSVSKGRVSIEGPWVLLFETNHKSGAETLVFGYCGQPGETITREGDDYSVDF